MENQLIITRLFDADVKLLWEAYTKDDHIAEWWGPKGLYTVVKANDFRPGGKWEFIMIDPKGNEYPAVGIYKEIIDYRKISSTDDFGAELRDNVQFDLPDILLYTALFEDLGEQTRLTLIYDHATPEDKQKHIKMGVEGGWNSSLNKLENYILKLKI